MRLVVASTIGWKTHISLFDDESEPCSGFEARRRCKNSARFTPRCTIISIRSAVSSRARFTNRDARLRWPSGAPLRRRSPSASGHVAPRAGDRCYSDKAVHGFRSSLRDWAGDETSFPREVCEGVLAHVVGGVEGAYRRSDALARRRELMDAWALQARRGD